MRFSFPLLFAFAATLLVSCGKDDGGTSTVAAPELVSVSPEDGTTDLTGTSLNVVFTYDQNIKVTSAGKSSVTVSGNASVANVNAYGKAVTVSVEGLEEGETYTVTIPAGVVQGYKDNQDGAAAASVSFTMKLYVSYDMDPDESLTNANATTRAKALYQFLLDNYGKRTVSGAMACIYGWDNTFADCINSAAGSYTGICGYDYLHMNWPAKYWSTCPDYGDISPVKNAWDAGSIIQICWHWSVPNSETAYNNSDFNNYSYSNKTFITAALTEGTWQHECIDAQIEKLAGYMKLLSDADIPVLFRPLHEAAGDYTWGSWFWWGYEGAEPCIKLWKYLRSKLEGTYGLNNLIWVWTVQTSDAGKLSAVENLEKWYPGEDYVDIVGSDLYVDQWTTQSSVFKRVNDSVQGKKMVALCEIGNLFDMDACYEEEAPWSYFLAWSNADSSGNPLLYSDSWSNSASDWKKVLGNSYVLNRGSVTNWK